ncbi:MAG: ABC transporter substrate-binding protein [Verrucomicrobiota bacterium]
MITFAQSMQQHSGTGQFRIWSILVFLLALVAGMSGCESTGGSGNSSSGSSSVIGPDPAVLRVGVTANMPPFVFRQNGELVGLEVDFAKQLATDMGREVHFVDMGFERLLPALQNNDVDIVMAGMNYTPERAAIISMTQPYLRSGQMALVLRKNASKYALPGLIGNSRDKVGAEAGTTGEFLVQSSFPNAQLKTYSSAEDGAMAVADGDVDILIHDAPTIYWLAGTYQNRGVTPARPVLTEDLMVWGIRRDNDQLLNSVNGLVTEWSRNGTLDRIAGRWISF